LTTTSEIGASLGIFGVALIILGVFIEAVYGILEANKPTPQSDYVNDVAPFLAKVKKPSEDWLRDHQIPSIQ
jgi:hypothetical protein